MIGHRYKLPFLSNRWQHRRAARKMVQLVWEIKLLQEPLSRFSLLEIILSDFIDSYKCAYTRFRMYEIIFLLHKHGGFSNSRGCREWAHFICEFRCNNGSKYGDKEKSNV